jgi:hypothetical protein
VFVTEDKTEEAGNDECRLNVIFLLNHQTQKLHQFKHYILHFNFRSNNDIKITLKGKRICINFQQETIMILLQYIFTF